MFLIIGLVKNKFRAQKWLGSNFVPIDFKKFGFWNFDLILRFDIRNRSESEKSEIKMMFENLNASRCKYSK